MALEITRNFVENRDSTYDLYEVPRIEDVGDKSQMPIRPFELKTYLKVGKSHDMFSTCISIWSYLCKALSHTCFLFFFKEKVKITKKMHYTLFSTYHKNMNKSVNSLYMLISTFWLFGVLCWLQHFWSYICSQCFLDNSLVFINFSTNDQLLFPHDFWSSIERQMNIILSVQDLLSWRNFVLP